MVMTAKEFATPCGTLRLTDADGNALSFRIAQDILPYKASVYDIIASEWVPVIRGGVQVGMQLPAQYDESKFRSYVLFPLSAA